MRQRPGEVDGIHQVLIRNWRAQVSGYMEGLERGKALSQTRQPVQPDVAHVLLDVSVAGDANVDAQTQMSEILLRAWAGGAGELQLGG